MSLNRGFKLVAILVVALALTGVAGAAATPPANQIFVHDQETALGVVVIDDVLAAQAGWVVVYKRADLASDMIVGYASVGAGYNHGIRVTVDTTRIEETPTLWVRLHEDKGAIGTFEWGNRGRALADAPVMEKGQFVLTTFGTAGGGPELNLVPKISIKSQDADANKIIVESVVAPVDGWLVIYRDASLHDQDIVGHAPVYHGTNQNFTVAVESWRFEKALTLWAVLYADKATPRVIEVGHMGLSKGDPMVLYNGLPIIQTFGTRAP